MFGRWDWIWSPFCSTTNNKVTVIFYCTVFRTVYCCPVSRCAYCTISHTRCNHPGVLAGDLVLVSSKAVYSPHMAWPSQPQNQTLPSCIRQPYRLIKGMSSMAHFICLFQWNMWSFWISEYKIHARCCDWYLMKWKVPFLTSRSTHRISRISNHATAVMFMGYMQQWCQIQRPPSYGGGDILHVSYSWSKRWQLFRDHKMSSMDKSLQSALGSTEFGYHPTKQYKEKILWCWCGV